MNVAGGVGLKGVAAATPGIAFAFAGLTERDDDEEPPLNCDWWIIGDSTPHPPEDRDFLTALANAGFKPFIAKGGLLGALCGDREIDVIHRGFGRRWRLGFLHAGKEESQAIVQELPRRTKAVVAWLHGTAIDEVMQLLDM